MKPFFSLSKTSSLFALLSMAVVFATMPSTASARSSVHIDLPQFSIGWHDDHYGKRYRKHWKRHYRDSHRYRHSNRHYRKRHYNKYGYYNNYYNDGYANYDFRKRYYKPRKRYYNRSYRNDYCPTDTYSRYYYEDSACYSHGDHYHCDG